MIQQRRSVFETNSSSTHSLTTANSERALYHVIDRIVDGLDTSNQVYLEQFIDELENPKRRVFILKSLEIAYGDECYNDYIIISSWYAKLQYIAMLMRSECSYDERFQDLECFKVLKKKVFEYAIKYNEHIDEVEFDGDLDSVYLEYIPDELKCITENIDDPEKLSKDIDAIMDEEFAIIDMDEAYHPYNGPQIRFY